MKGSMDELDIWQQLDAPACLTSGVRSLSHGISCWDMFCFDVMESACANQSIMNRTFDSVQIGAATFENGIFYEHVHVTKLAFYANLRFVVTCKTRVKISIHNIYLHGLFVHVKVFVLFDAWLYLRTPCWSCLRVDHVGFGFVFWGICFYLIFQLWLILYLLK